MKLQKMTDFVLEQRNPNANINEMISEYQKVINYAKFLQQTLTLGIFVPCDEDGNVLEIPKCFGKGGGWNCACSDALMQLCIDKTTQYQKAQEKVLFKGFDEESAMELMYYNDNVEQVANFNGFELTESAMKQIGL